MRIDHVTSFKTANIKTEHSKRLSLYINEFKKWRSELQTSVQLKKNHCQHSDRRAINGCHLVRNTQATVRYYIKSKSSNAITPALEIRGRDRKISQTPAFCVLYVDLHLLANTWEIDVGSCCSTGIEIHLAPVKANDIVYRQLRRSICSTQSLQARLKKEEDKEVDVKRLV